MLFYRIQTPVTRCRPPPRRRRLNIRTISITLLSPWIPGTRSCSPGHCLGRRSRRVMCLQDPDASHPLPAVATQQTLEHAHHVQSPPCPLRFRPLTVVLARSLWCASVSGRGTTAWNRQKPWGGSWKSMRRVEWKLMGLHVDERYQSQFESRTDSFAAVVYV